MNDANQIISLLEDTSFPQMLLIDGAWGSGKTFFIRNTLTDEMKKRFNQEVHYLSLYGLVSIDDFRDKIISLLITEKASSKIGFENLTKLVDGVASFAGEKGVGAILNGAAGACKLKMYSTLDSCVLVLDDLERVASEKLIRNILGEGLNLAETRNIKVIVVANEDKISCKHDLEKVFVDQYKFSCTTQDIVNILESDYGTIITPFLKDALISIIDFLGAQNIRVIKRAVFKYSKIHKQILENDNLDTKESCFKVLRQMLTICFVRFELGHSEEDIKESCRTSFLRYMSSDEASPTDAVDVVLDKLAISLDSDLITYCCTGLYCFSDIASELSLPLKGDLVNGMINGFDWIGLSEEDFSRGVKEVEIYIGDEKNILIKKWFSACDIYLEWHAKKAISGARYSVDQIFEKCQSIPASCFKTVNKDDYDHIDGSNFYNKQIGPLFNKKVKEVHDHSRSTDISGFIDRFCHSPSTISRDELDNFKLTPILQNITPNRLRISLGKWENHDLQKFIDFIRYRYNSVNISDFLSGEYDAICNFIPEVESLTEELEPSLKVYNLNEIVNIFTNVKSKLKIPCHNPPT